MARKNRHVVQGQSERFKSENNFVVEGKKKMKLECIYIGWYEIKDLVGSAL